MGCCRRLSEAEKTALPECRRNLKMERHTTRCERICSRVLLYLLFVLILITTTLGILLGLYLKDHDYFKDKDKFSRFFTYLIFPAEILVSIFKFLTLPIIVSSVISGLGSLTSKISRHVGLWLVLIYFCTSILAATEGLLWAFAFKPDTGLSLKQENYTSSISLDCVDIILDFVRSVRLNHKILKPNT